jgi:hypothetical protein
VASLDISDDEYEIGGDDADDGQGGGQGGSTKNVTKGWLINLKALDASESHASYIRVGIVYGSLAKCF